MLSLAAYRLGNLTYSGIGKGIGDIVNKSSGGDGYPYTVSSAQVKSLQSGSSDLVVLYDTGVRVLGSSAKEISDLQHNYSSPMMFTFGSRLLVADSFGTKFRVQTPSKLSYEMDFPFEILTADIAKNGYVVIASRTDAGSSMLTVLDGKRREVYKWRCAKEQIVCVDISDDGKYIVCGVVGAENGDVYSDVYLFDIRYEDAVRTVKFEGTSVVKVEMLKGKNFLVVGDNLVTFVNGKGDRKDVDVSLNSVSRCCVSENNITALLLSKYGSAYSKILKVYNASGKEISSVDIECSVKSMSIYGKHIALLSEGKLLSYNLYGKQIGEKTIDNDAVSCCIGSNGIYVLHSNSINKYSITGRNTKTEKTTTDNSENEKSDNG